MGARYSKRVVQVQRAKKVSLTERSKVLEAGFRVAFVYALSLLILRCLALLTQLFTPYPTTSTTATMLLSRIHYHPAVLCLSSYALSFEVLSTRLSRL